MISQPESQTAETSDETEAMENEDDSVPIESENDTNIRGNVLLSKEAALADSEDTQDIKVPLLAKEERDNSSVDQSNDKEKSEEFLNVKEMTEDQSLVKNPSESKFKVEPVKEDKDMSGMW